jgi:predicted Zn-dependent protease
MTLFAGLLAPIHRWRVMRDLRSFDKHQTYDAKWDFRDLLARAKEALDRDLPVRAGEIWADAYARFPDLAMLSEPALDLMLRLGLQADAENLLNRAVKRHPNDAHAQEGLTRLAFERKDYADAVIRAEGLRKKFPQSLKGYWIGAASLSFLGRSTEADAILNRGLQVAPDNLILRVEYARLAERSEDWEAAIKRWTYVHETLRHAAGTIGLATAFSRLARYDEADALIASVVHRSGNDIGIWIASTQIAEQKQDWAEAARRWQVICERFPLVPTGYIGASKALLRLPRHDEADAIIKEGIERVPGDVALFVEHALMAHRSGDWSNAAARWSTVRQRFPTCQEAYAREADALEALHRPAEAAAIRAMPAA